MSEYYVDNASGNDGNAGDADHPWASLAHAADTVAAGDTVHIKSGTEYTAQDGSNNCNLQITTAGTVTAPILWQGYTTTPGDSGMAIINANGYNQGVSNSGSDYQIYKNMQVKNASYDGFYCSSGNQTWINCVVNNNGRYGINMAGNGLYVKCTIHNNGSHGITAGNYYNLS